MVLAGDQVVVQQATWRNGQIERGRCNKRAPQAGAVGTRNRTATGKGRNGYSVSVDVVHDGAGRRVPSVVDLGGPLEVQDLRRDRGITQTVARKRITLVQRHAAAVEIRTHRYACHVIEHDFTAAHTLGWIVLIRGLTVTPLDFLLVLPRLIWRYLSLRGDADAALLGATEVVALQGVVLIRLAILLTELIWRQALTIGITVVFLHRRAHQVHADGVAGLVVDDLLTGTLSLTGKVANTPLRLLTVWSLSLRRSAVASLVLTPVVFATRGLVLIGLAQKVSERVLRQHGSW